MSLRLVPPLPAGTPGDPGLTGPGSVTWRVSRERVMPLGGRRSAETSVRSGER
jgi:uncharacterized protein (DUF2236 family)